MGKANECEIVTLMGNFLADQQNVADNRSTPESVTHLFVGNCTLPQRERNVFFMTDVYQLKMRGKA